MTVKPFRLLVTISGDFWRTDPKMAEALAREVIKDQAADLRGPRGGRYEAINEPHGFEVGPMDDFTRDQRAFTARVTGRYVRPKS